MTAKRGHDRHGFEDSRVRARLAVLRGQPDAAEIAAAPGADARPGKPGTQDRPRRTESLVSSPAGG